MWTAIFGTVIVLAVCGFAYLCNRIYRLIPQRAGLINKQSKLARALYAVAVLAAFMYICSAVAGVINGIIIIIHLLVFWAVFDLVFWIIKKIRRKGFSYPFAAALAVVVAFVYLVVGFVLANNVWVKRYEMTTDKAVGNLRVVMIADSHVGATFDGARFAEYVKEIQNQRPDIVIVAGDFVDDDTSRDDMIASCRALGTLETAYGVYFAFGNHDAGYYASARGYSGDDLIAELEKNNVTVLRDEYVEIDGRFYVVGRRDASDMSRKPASELAMPLDKNKFSIVIDHQPNDYDNECAAGVDLVLSGHTHGGQMIPIGLISDMFGLNDRVYGREKRGNTEFIVTSGISDWAIKFKTGCKSEYVVIDIKGN